VCSGGGACAVLCGGTGVAVSARAWLRVALAAGEAFVCMEGAVESGEVGCSVLQYVAVCWS